MIDGNLSEADECDETGPNAGLICLTEDDGENSSAMLPETQ